MGKRSIRVGSVAISRQTYIGIFDLRLSLTGEFYRPFVSDLATATKEHLVLEIIKLTGEPSRRHKLVRMNRAALVRELLSVAGQRLAKFDSDHEFKSAFYAALSKRKAERNGAPTRQIA